MLPASASATRPPQCAQNGSDGSTILLHRGQRPGPAITRAAGAAATEPADGARMMRAAEDVNGLPQSMQKREA